MQKGMVIAVSLLKSSGYRLKIVQAIGNDTLTPSEISNKINIRLNHVSLFLKELKNKNLVKCLNEESRKGRLYELTELGKNAINKLLKSQAR
ncbi:MarR family transcriptional regulator [Candidatus Woesearchaeota archaeon]|nr:MarR family transcriptional regulator [Candidatus Woesearchaeota archaeon]